MSTPESRPPRKVRRDGWTPDRQMRFLDALASTRSVAKSAAYAGMSREGAYRFRNRSGGSLFALLWDRALAPVPTPPEGHKASLTDGRLMRLLGIHYRRECGDFADIGARKDGTPASDRARTW